LSLKSKCNHCCNTNSIMLPTRDPLCTCNTPNIMQGNAAKTIPCNTHQHSPTHCNTDDTTIHRDTNPDAFHTIVLYIHVTNCTVTNCITLQHTATQAFLCFQNPSASKVICPTCVSKYTPRPTNKAYTRALQSRCKVNWCYIYYFVRNSLIALLEASCAQIFCLDSWISDFSDIFCCVCKKMYQRNLYTWTCDNQKQNTTGF